MLLLLLIQCTFVAKAFEAKVWRRTRRTRRQQLALADQLQSSGPQRRSSSWEVAATATTSSIANSIGEGTNKSQRQEEDRESQCIPRSSSRRETLAAVAAASAFAVTTWWTPAFLMNAVAAAENPLNQQTASISTLTENSQQPVMITDYIFLTIKGIPPAATATTESQDKSAKDALIRQTDKIVIGLYGKIAHTLSTSRRARTGQGTARSQ
jgi:hypothetical protein